MNPLRHQSWLRTARLVGVVYLLIIRISALPASHVQLWRLAAWLLSGFTFAAHINYENRRLHNSPRVSALHVALGVATGAVALALAGMVHDLSTGAGFRPAWLLALALLPAMTAIPAFLVALGAGALLTRLRPGTQTE
jgi:hypothetical protein